MKAIRHAARFVYEAIAVNNYLHLDSLIEIKFIKGISRKNTEEKIHNFLVYFYGALIVSNSLKILA